jgi:hypothetical protein
MTRIELGARRRRTWAHVEASEIGEILSVGQWQEVGGRALSNMSDELGLPDDALGAYFRTVQAASPWNQALTMIADEAAKLAAKTRRHPQRLRRRSHVAWC